MRLKEMRKIEKKNDEYLLEQIKLIYASTAIALKRAYNWEKHGIVKLMDLTHEVWNECAATNERRMIQMLDEETAEQQMIDKEVSHGETAGEIQDEGYPDRQYVQEPEELLQDGQGD